MAGLFHIRREERIPAVVALIFITILHVLNIMKYYDRFSVIADNYHDVFVGKYIVSGFDPFTYQTVSKWDVLYEVTRHPLMAFYMYVPAKINEVLITLTGSNWATIIVGILWAMCAFYAFIFLFRILHELQSLRIKHASLLCALFYSFGYTMLSIFVPDHFGPSVMLLLMTIYVIGRNIQEKKEIGLWQSILLFTLTAGVSLSNGLKVFIAALFNKGRNFFKPKYLICAVILPAVLLFGFAQLEQYIFVRPRVEAAKQERAEADKKWRADVYKTYCDTASNLDSAAVQAGVKKIIHDKIWEKFRADHKQPWNEHKGEALAKTGYASWTDISTPRCSSIIENVLGEPVQIHEDYLLEDVLRSRPVIVNYNHWYNYLAELLLAILLIAGIIIGRKSRIVQIALSFLAFDMLLHLGLGFGLNEVYIMSPHFLFTFPIFLASLFKIKSRICKQAVILSTFVLTIWFAYWNLSLLLPFLTSQI